MLPLNLATDREVAAMIRLVVLLCALALCGGCLSDSDRAEWNAALKDARGDNQRMRNDFSGQLPSSELRQSP
jgi:hypothetical protein